MVAAFSDQDTARRVSVTDRVRSGRESSLVVPVMPDDSAYAWEREEARDAEDAYSRGEPEDDLLTVRAINNDQVGAGKWRRDA